MGSCDREMAWKDNRGGKKAKKTEEDKKAKRNKIEKFKKKE